MERASNFAVQLSLLVAVCMAALIYGVPSASAQQQAGSNEEACPLPQIRTNVRPDPAGTPTPVTVGVRLIDLREINDVDQTITVDLGILRTWTDMRLAHLEGCEIALDEVWYPELIARNSGRLFERWPREVSIGPNGEVRYIQRFFGTIASYHNLHDFPFDTQSIIVQLITLKWPDSDVQLIADETFSGMVEQLNISDWIVTSVMGKVDSQYVKGFERDHARYNFEITAHRIRAYYVWKIILPLCLIVAMSWCVFWIDPAAFGTQIGLSATAMLTLIAFIFATTNMVPVLGYFTLLDLFIGGATILVFLALLESLATSYLVSRDKAALAMRIDRICRFVFPATFAIIAFAVFLR